MSDRTGVESLTLPRPERNRAGMRKEGEHFARQSEAAGAVECD